jgi:ribosomal protein L31E
MADERLYTINLRREWLKVSKWRRAKRAAGAARTFLLRHTKAKEVVFGRWMNEAIWAQGASNPIGKITVRVTKDKDIARAELAELPTRAKRVSEAAQKEVKKKDVKKTKAEEKQKEEDYKKKKDEEKKALEQAKQYQSKITKEQEISMHK